MKRVAVFGAGGHGKVVLDSLLESGVEVAGFCDDDPRKKGAKTCGLEVLGGWEELKKRGLAVALGVGSNSVRRALFERAEREGIEVVSAVHPRASVSRLAKLGRGVAVMAGAVINAGAEVGDGAVVNTSASVDHDCRLDRFCQIWPGAVLAGTVSVGEEAYVGAGASVIQNLAIGRRATVGAGAAVVRDVPDGAVVAGVPARTLPPRKR